MRYHKTIYAPPEPLPVTVKNKQSSDISPEKKENGVEEIDDKIYESIFYHTQNFPQIYTDERR